MRTEYYLSMAEDPEEFRNGIDYMLNRADWELYGSPYIMLNNIHCQALVRKLPNIKESTEKSDNNESQAISFMLERLYTPLVMMGLLMIGVINLVAWLKMKKQTFRRR